MPYSVMGKLTPNIASTKFVPFRLIGNCPNSRKISNLKHVENNPQVFQALILGIMQYNEMQLRSLLCFCWIKSKEDCNQCLIQSKRTATLSGKSFFFLFSLFSFVVDFLYIKEVELTDEEEAIKANLMDSEALPPEVLDNIIPDWWKKEPFR